MSKTTSPGSAEYGVSDPESHTGMPWTSCRRHAALIPLSNGKTTPSKWDDAERWISSPSSGQQVSPRTPVAQPLRRGMKSKSGPLGTVHSSNRSPSTPTQGGNLRNSTVEMPRTSGPLVTRGLLFGDDDGIRMKFNSNSLDVGNHRSCSGDVLNSPPQNFVSNSQGGNKEVKDKFNEKEVMVSKVIDDRDCMATEMSSEGSIRFTTKESFSFSTQTTYDHNVATDEVRDVQVDKRDIFPRTGEFKKQEPINRIEKNLNDIDEVCSPPKASKASRNTSKLQRGEAKITAWENLQKADAERAIQKLEMKLEKKRLESTAKIMNKLKAAEMKAEAMRKALSENDGLHADAVHATTRLSCCSNVKDCSVRDCFVNRT